MQYEIQNFIDINAFEMMLIFNAFEMTLCSQNTVLKMDHWSSSFLS